MKITIKEKKDYYSVTVETKEFIFVEKYEYSIKVGAAVDNSINVALQSLRDAYADLDNSGLTIHEEDLQETRDWADEVADALTEHLP